MKESSSLHTKGNTRFM